MVTSREFQEGIPVPFDLPESSPGTTVAVVDQNPSQVRRNPRTWGSQTWDHSIHKALRHSFSRLCAPRFPRDG